jgi:hypothetical protein
MTCIHTGPTQTFIISEVFGCIRNASLKWDFSFGGIGIDKVGFCTDNVYDDVVTYVFLEFEKPLDRSNVRGGGEIRD